MSIELELCLKHLKALVACDTSNPPKNIQQSGLLDYLQSLSFIEPQVTDLGEGSYNVLLTKGSPKYLFNVHLDTVPAGEGWNFDPHNLTIQENKAFGLGAQPSIWISNLRLVGSSLFQQFLSVQRSLFG